MSMSARLILWRFWIYGGGALAALGLLVIVLFVLDDGGQIGPGALGVAFLIIGCIAVAVGLKQVRSRRQPKR